MSEPLEREIERLCIERDELAAAAKRVSAQLQSFMNDTTDPGTEALAAQYELNRLLSLLSIDTSAVDEAAYLSRFSATPSEIHRFLANRLPEDVHLHYQQAIGGRAVAEAAKDIRMETAQLRADGVLEHDKDWAASAAADYIDPLKGGPLSDGGPYPSKLIRFGETGGAQ